MKRPILVCALLVSTLSVSALQTQPPRLEHLDSPAGARTEAPQLTVSDRGVLMSWIERGTNNQASLKFSERTATGWSEVRTVASGTDWFVNWADVPSVLRLADGSLVGHWLQKSGSSTYAYDVRLSRSTDDGRTWSPSVTPHHDGTQTEHGFASLFQVPGAGLGLIWLDGRQTAPAGGGGAGHDGHGTGAMTVRYGAFDGQFAQSAEMPIDLRVCECCPTTAAVTSDGLIAAFRNRTEDEIRDIYVSRFENGKWTEPKVVHNDNWQIAACPVNGPMLSARGRDVVISWFTGVDEPGRAYVAFSKDAGRTFGAPIRVDDVATLGRVDVELMPDGSALATWIELADRRAEFRARRIQQGGTRGAALKVADLATSRSSGYPRVARHGDELVFAWTEVTASTPGSRPTTQVRTAIAK
jgi:hypothetical protein